MPTYAPVRPPADLAEELVCRWDATFVGRHDLVPDACVELMWLEGRGLLVCGPDTRGWSFDHGRPREGSGLRFRPGAAARHLRIPLCELTDAKVDYADLVGARHARVLTERLDAAPASRRSELLVEEVRRLGGAGRDLPLAPVVAVLSRSDRSIAELSRVLGTSERQLHRLALRELGYGTSVLRSVLRLQRFMESARSRPGLGLAALAAGAGYADQAHLARDSRRLAGMTPTTLLASMAPIWHGTGSVVEAGAAATAAVTVTG